jgi:hypothetical protein
MAYLVYSAISSLDGYVADEDGNFDWAVPDVRDDGRLGDKPCPPRRPVARDAGVRGDLAGRRQDRVFQNARGGVNRQDADRACL